MISTYHLASDPHNIPDQDSQDLDSGRDQIPVLLWAVVWPSGDEVFCMQKPNFQTHDVSVFAKPSTCRERLRVAPDWGPGFREYGLGPGIYRESFQRSGSQLSLPFWIPKGLKYKSRVEIPRWEAPEDKLATSAVC